MPLKELVLGGEGLIGAALVRLLRGRHAEVRSLDLKSGFDLRSASDLSLSEYDRVWFLAWDAGGAKYIEAAERQHQIFRNNAEICARVFDALARASRPFLFTTSQLAGQPNGYGLTKLMAEQWARQLGGSVARLWNVYGWEPPGVRSHVVTDLALSGLRNREIRLRTTGRERRRLLYKLDCAEALVQMFDAGHKEGDIAGSEWISVVHVAEEISTLLGVGVTPGRDEGHEVMVDPVNSLPGWRPRTSLREGLQLVIGEARTFLAEEGAGR